MKQLSEIWVSIKKIPVSAKASFAFIFASIVTSGIAYITTPIYTRILPAEIYGQTSVFLTWVNVLGKIAMFCLSAGVFNNGMCDYPEKRDEYSLSMLSLSNVITLVFSIIIVVFGKQLRPLLSMDTPLLVLMCILFFTQPAYNFWIARQRYELKYKGVLICSIINAMIAPIGAIICLQLVDDTNKLYARLFGAEIPCIVLYLCFYILLFRNNKGRVETKYWKEAILFNLPLIPHYLSMYMLASSDKIMISKIINPKATAYYSVAYSVASVASIILTAVNSVLIPFTYEKCKSEDYEPINKISLSIIGLFGLMCVIIIMFAPEVVSIMGTDDYMEAVYVIPPVISGVFFQVLYYAFANILYYFKKPKYVLLGSLTSVITNIVLNYIFIPQYGYIAAGYTTLFCYLLQAIVDGLAMKKAVGFNIYDLKPIILMSIIIITIGLVSGLFYDNYIIRYAIIIVLCAALFSLRNKIISMLKLVKNKSR